MKKSSFSEWTAEDLENTFDLELVKKHPVLENWLDAKVESLTDFEKQNLNFLQNLLKERVEEWNEADMREFFIGPLINLVDLYHKKFRYFAERKLTGVIGNYQLSGDVDALIASGRGKPKAPYFCFHEYKQEASNKHPLGQALVAMLVAQSINKDEKPIYGAYNIGRNWFFVLLDGKKYAKSNGYMATRKDLYQIFFIFRALKRIILKRIEGK